MRGHVMPVDPLVHGVIADPEVFADLAYGQPAVFHFVHVQNSTGILGLQPRPPETKREDAERTPAILKKLTRYTRSIRSKSNDLYRFKTN